MSRVTCWSAPSVREMESSERIVNFLFHCQDQAGTHILKFSHEFPATLFDHDYGSDEYFEDFQSRVDPMQNHMEDCLQYSFETCSVCSTLPTKRVLLATKYILNATISTVKNMTTAICQNNHCEAEASIIMKNASELLDRHLEFIEVSLWPEVNRVVQKHSYSQDILDSKSTRHITATYAVGNTQKSDDLKSSIKCGPSCVQSPELDVDTIETINGKIADPISSSTVSSSPTKGRETSGSSMDSSDKIHRAATASDDQALTRTVSIKPVSKKEVFRHSTVLSYRTSPPAQDLPKIPTRHIRPNDRAQPLLSRNREASSRTSDSEEDDSDASLYDRPKTRKQSSKKHLETSDSVSKYMKTMDLILAAREGPISFRPRKLRRDSTTTISEILNFEVPESNSPSAHSVATGALQQSVRQKRSVDILQASKMLLSSQTQTTISARPPPWSSVSKKSLSGSIDIPGISSLLIRRGTGKSSKSSMTDTSRSSPIKQRKWYQTINKS